MTEDIFIVAARRTPIGAFQGALSGATALVPRLGYARVGELVATSRRSRSWEELEPGAAAQPV